MKKAILSLAVVALALASCKKDYTCECTSKVNGASSGSADSYTLVKASKAQAKANCIDTKSTETVLGTTYTYETDCTLK